MKRLFLSSVLGLAICAALSDASANAQGPYCGGWGGWGINYPFGLYGSRINDVPYFSMFPPVYYSVPIPRTYGWSPFAYPPGTMTPEIEPPLPQDMTNPYVPQDKEQSKSAKPIAVRTASYRAPVPQVLINPHMATAKVAQADTK